MQVWYTSSVILMCLSKVKCQLGCLARRALTFLMCLRFSMCSLRESFNFKIRCHSVAHDPKPVARQNKCLRPQMSVSYKCRRKHKKVKGFKFYCRPSYLAETPEEPLLLLVKVMNGCGRDLALQGFIKTTFYLCSLHAVSYQGHMLLLLWRSLWKRDFSGVCD